MQASRAGWMLMVLLAVSISLYALAFLFFEPVGAPFLKEKYALTPIPTWMHILGGAVALIIGPLQLSRRFRSHNIPRHRLLGMLYVVAVVIGGAGGFYIAFDSLGGTSGHLGFGTLAVLWIVTTLMAFAAISRGDRNAHRKWMIRSFALTFAAVTLRLYMPVFNVGFGLEMEATFALVAWLCWVPNLLVAEWTFQERRVVERVV